MYIALLLPQVNAWGEGTPRILRFDPATIDIDTVKFDAGEINICFECTNICDKPVVIIDVRSQCGCAKASFSSKSIAPGEKGRVNVVFDPKTLFADQKRHLTVVATNGDYKKFNTLTITGYVDRGVTVEEVRYPHLLSPELRSDLDVVGMRLSQRGAVPVREITVYNTSPDELKLDWTSEDKCVRAEVPSVLKPGEKARIKISVNTRKIPSGPYNKTLYLIINGKQSAPITLKGAVE